MYNAQPVIREQLPRAYEAVERLTAKQGLPLLDLCAADGVAGKRSLQGGIRNMLWQLAYGFSGCWMMRSLRVCWRMSWDMCVTEIS